MILPRFTLDQDDQFFILKIDAPNSDVEKVNVRITDDELIFCCEPYYMRLILPGKIEEEDRLNFAKFCCETNKFILKYKKVNTGEHFPDLTIPTSHLCSESKVFTENSRQKIEVLESTSNDDKTESAIQDSMKYLHGFALKGGYNLKMVFSEFSDLFEINPIEVKFEDRSRLRYTNEASSFNMDAYIYYIFEPDEVNELISLTSPWKELKTNEIKFTSRELDILKSITNVDYCLSKQQVSFCFNSLLEILYSYCYDRRTTFFEGTCESGWNIAKLSASLCCFDSFVTVKSTLVSCYRRSLIYPLYRSFKLNEKVLEDLRVLVNHGEQYIIKCLIDIYNIFLEKQDYYIFNNLFIKDYIVYVSKWDKSLWQETVRELNNITISKSDLNLNLVSVEDNDLTDKIAKLNICEDDSDDSSSDDETETESEESGDSESESDHEEND